MTNYKNSQITDYKVYLSVHVRMLQQDLHLMVHIGFILSIVSGKGNDYTMRSVLVSPGGGF